MPPSCECTCAFMPRGKVDDTEASLAIRPICVVRRMLAPSTTESPHSPRPAAASSSADAAPSSTRGRFEPAAQQHHRHGDGECPRGGAVERHPALPLQGGDVVENLGHGDVEGRPVCRLLDEARHDSSRRRRGRDEMGGGPPTTTRTPTIGARRPGTRRPHHQLARCDTKGAGRRAGASSRLPQAQAVWSTRDAHGCARCSDEGAAW